MLLSSRCRGYIPNSQAWQLKYLASLGLSLHPLYLLRLSGPPNHFTPLSGSDIRSFFFFASQPVLPSLLLRKKKIGGCLRSVIAPPRPPFLSWILPCLLLEFRCHAQVETTLQFGMAPREFPISRLCEYRRTLLYITGHLPHQDT